MTHSTFPKIDLHLHLDGAVNPQTSWELALEQGVELPTKDRAEFDRFCKVTSDCTCKTLYDFLQLFEVPLAVMQQPAALVRCTRELVERLAKQGLIYAEIRFAPQNHVRQGMTQRDAIEAVLEGARQGMAAQPSIRVGIILCTMILGDVELNRAENEETVELAAEFLGKGVVALDLAGAEGKAPMTDFSCYFARAKELGVPFTVHAGEGAGAPSVWAALEFGPQRIGHGARSIEDPALVEELVRRQIPLELCVTSNVQCHLFPDAAHHSIRALHDAGVITTFNTDNMVISDIDLDHESRLLQEELGFTIPELVYMELNAVHAAFLPDGEKERLTAELTRYL